MKPFVGLNGTKHSSFVQGHFFKPLTNKIVQLVIIQFFKTATRLPGIAFIPTRFQPAQVASICLGSRTNTVLTSQLHQHFNPARFLRDAFDHLPEQVRHFLFFDQNMPYLNLMRCARHATSLG
ncbi:uncharacterized protein METZ01_LOCUS213967 [marine metagenome]|uniref:Uncharacterized protein n=1 Tax=marine metagenome TaxID=408172 RepID=A0A382FFW1_9ZZZZ